MFLQKGQFQWFPIIFSALQAPSEYRCTLKRKNLHPQSLSSLSIFFFRGDAKINNILIELYTLKMYYSEEQLKICVTSLLKKKHLKIMFLISEKDAFNCFSLDFFSEGDWCAEKRMGSLKVVFLVKVWLKTTKIYVFIWKQFRNMTKIAIYMWSRSAQSRHSSS